MHLVRFHFGFSYVTTLYVFGLIMNHSVDSYLTVQCLCCCNVGLFSDMTATLRSWCHLLTRGAQYFIRATLAGLWRADKYTRRCSLAGAKLSLSVILSRYRLRCSTLVVHKLEGIAQQNSAPKNTQFKTDLTPFPSSLSVIFLFTSHFKPSKVQWLLYVLSVFTLSSVYFAQNIFMGSKLFCK